MFIQILKRISLILLLILFLTFSSPSFAVSILDVVISEVAWSGTTANTNHEWIELYNNTSEAIDITGWTLKAIDGTPNISLSGIISAKSYFLLERTSGDATSVAEDQIYSGALIDSGESLELRSNDGALVDTASINGGAWPAGTGGTGIPVRASMERLNLQEKDSDSNWVTNDGVTRNGLDANGNPINGTPKSQNSQGFVPPTPTPTEAPTPTKTPTSTKAPTSTKSPTATKEPTSTEKLKKSPTPKRESTSNSTPSKNTATSSKGTVAGASEEKVESENGEEGNDKKTPAYAYSLTTGLGMLALACGILLYKKYKAKNEEDDI